MDRHPLDRPICSDLSYETFQRRRRNFELRFWSKVEKRSGAECWPWLASKAHFGHGQFKVGGKHGSCVHAHRVAWELTFGDIPAGAVVRHRCDNPPCVNPAHLVIGTQDDNINDRVRRGRSAAGDKHGRAKLTSADVANIRLSQEPISILAKNYGVNRETVRAAKSGRNWKALEA